MYLHLSLANKKNNRDERGGVLIVHHLIKYYSFQEFRI
jgi:hypothetical protein